MHCVLNISFRSYKEACESYTCKAHKLLLLGSKDDCGGNDDALLVGELLQLETDIERVKNGNDIDGTYIENSNV